MSRVMMFLFAVAPFFILTYAEASSGKTYLLEPAISEKTVGFEIKPDEYDEYYARIRCLLPRGSVKCVLKLTYGNIAGAMAEKSTIYIFSILDYFITYRSLGKRDGHMASLLLKYVSDNEYKYPERVYLSKVISTDNWGRNSPLEAAIDSTFNTLGNVRNVGVLDSDNLQKPLETVINDGFRCVCPNVLLWPEFSNEKMGYESDKEEIYDFAHHLAYLCGTLIGEDVHTITKEVAEGTSECLKNVFDIDFNVPGLIMKLTLKDAVTKEVIYDYSTELKKTSDWNEKDEYSRKIESLFRKIKRDYRKKNR